MDFSFSEDQSMLADSVEAAVKAEDSRPWDVAAYLSSLTDNAPTGKVGDAVAGGKLFDSLGCIACHQVNCSHHMTIGSEVAVMVSSKPSACTMRPGSERAVGTRPQITSIRS